MKTSKQLELFKTKISEMHDYSINQKLDECISDKMFDLELFIDSIIESFPIINKAEIFERLKFILDDFNILYQIENYINDIIKIEQFLNSIHSLVWINSSLEKEINKLHFYKINIFERVESCKNDEKDCFVYFEEVKVLIDKFS